jgi:glutaredoxin/uncharacterized protein (DUF302 family)
MIISYFRKSKNSLGEILKDLKNTAEKEGIEIVGEKEILDGKGRVVYFNVQGWVEKIVNDDHNILPFLPLTLFIFEKEDGVVVGGGRGAILGNFAYDEGLFQLAQEIENKMKKFINEVAKVGELKPIKVKLYSTTTCPYCKMEKAWLDANKITYEQVFVDLDQKAGEEMIRKTGQAGVPVTEIIYEDSDPDYIVGFDKHQLEHILGIEHNH